MSQVVYDFNSMSNIFSHIEQSLADMNLKIPEMRDKMTEVLSIYEAQRDGVVRGYADTVDEYSEICRNLSEVSSTLMDMRTLRKQIAEMRNTTPATEQKFRTRVEFIVKDLEDTRMSLGYLKDAYEARVRFYNSSMYAVAGVKY